MKLLKKILPFATIASVATVGLTAMVGCSNNAPAQPFTKEWDLSTWQEWDHEYEEKHTGPFLKAVVTDDYFDAAAKNYKIFADDMAYTNIESTLAKPTIKTDYSKIITRVIDIDSETWRMTYELELISKNPTQVSPTIKLRVKDFVYTVELIDYYQDLSYQGSFWTVQPMVLWLSNESADLAYRYLKSDDDWKIHAEIDNGGELVILDWNYLSSRERINEFISTYIKSFDLSYLTHYWSEDKPEDIPSL